MHPLQLAMLSAVACVALLAALGRLGFLHEEFGGRARRALAMLLLLAILTGCVFYPAVARDQSVMEPDTLWFPALFLGHFLFATFLLSWWRLRADISLVRLLHLDQLILDDLGSGIRFGCMGWVATMLVTASVALLLQGAGAAGQTAELPPFMLWIAHLSLLRKLVVILVAMTVEEAFFRGFLQPRIGWIPSSLLFVLGHASYGLPLMLVSVLVISLVLGWRFRQTQRLLPCIMAHGTFDAIQLLIVIPWAVHTLEGKPLRVLAGL